MDAPNMLQPLKQVQANLIRRGLLLYAEAIPPDGITTKLQRLRFRFPAEFEAFLPPLLPGARSAAGDGQVRSEVLRQKLLELVGEGRPQSAPDAQRFVLNIVDGMLRIGQEPFRAALVQQWQQAGWSAELERTKTQAKALPVAETRRRSLTPVEAVQYICAKLPEGQWAPAEALTPLLEVFCYGHQAIDGPMVCEVGRRWGCLARREIAGQMCYRLPAAEPTTPDPATHLGVLPDGSAVINLHTVPYDALEQIAAVSKPQPAGSGPYLLATPHLVRLGRALASVRHRPALRWLQENAATYREALALAAERWGKQIIHTNLLVARVTDPGLRVQYVRTHSIKRSVRGNQLPRADAARLARLLNDSAPDEEPNGIFRCEFSTPSVLGRLDPFTSWGSATEVMTILQFAPARRFLLEVLARCERDVWLSTASLVAYLKANYPHFLIPPGPLKDRWGQPMGRFSCFHKCIESPYGQGEEIPESAADAFERIEGRYIERFLEGIPFIMGYVDVAYDENPPPQPFPSRNVLQAFRVKERLVRSLRGQIAEPTVMVQPNLEIYVQAEVYPARVLAQLAPLADVLTSDMATILKLRREKVAAAVAQDERLNVIQLLEQLSGRELPQNIVRELREWTEHSSKFTLYVNYAVWEGEMPDELPAVRDLVAAEIGPQVRLTHAPTALLAELEVAGRMPMWIKPKDDAFARVPDGAQTIFRRKTAAEPPAPAEKPTVEVRRETQITLHLPTEEVWERVRKALADARCSLSAERRLRTSRPCAATKPRCRRRSKR